MVLPNLMAPALAKLFRLMTLLILVFTFALIVITMAESYERTTVLDLGPEQVTESATADIGKLAAEVVEQ